jgi:hypothetical protein
MAIKRLESRLQVDRVLRKTTKQLDAICEK